MMAARAEQYDDGRDRRTLVSRGAHGEWAPALDRPDPIDVLLASNTGRLDDLIPIRFGRMATSPFAFMRGSAALMAADLRSVPTTGLDVQACGDCHLMNFGLFATPERNVVTIVGEIPTGFPSFVWPDLPPVRLASLVLGSLAIIFIGYSESLAAAKEEGAKHDYEIDASQEMVAQGMANVGSGLVGGYAVEGSLSKTTVADMAGQKTQLASLLTAGLILVTILLLTGFFTNLPDAVLGAVVIDAGISLIKFDEFRHYRLSMRDFAAFTATALAVFFVGVLAGVVAGVVIALLLLIVSASESPTRQMAFDREHDVYVHFDHHPDAELIPGILVVGIYGPLFFADADNFRNSVLDFVKSYDPHTVVVDLTAFTMMDMDGVRALSQLARELNGKQVAVLLVNVGGENIELMHRTGTVHELGAHSIHPTVRDAVASAQNE